MFFVCFFVFYNPCSSNPCICLHATRACIRAHVKTLPKGARAVLWSRRLYSRSVTKQTDIFLNYYYQSLEYNTIRVKSMVPYLESIHVKFLAHSFQTFTQFSLSVNQSRSVPLLKEVCGLHFPPTPCKT